MTELIKVTQGEKGQIVNAKDLYTYLEYNPSHWKRWSERNIVKDVFFSEGVDYVALARRENGNLITDFALTINMAKELSMLSRTIKGKEAREYFLECEKMSRAVVVPSYQIDDPIVRANSWIEEQKITLQLKERNEKLEPRSLYFDKMINTDGLVSMQEVAKLLNIPDMGRNKMFEKLRVGNVIMKNSTTPYQHFVNKGYFELKEDIVILKGDVRKVNVTTFVTQKGLAFIFKFFGLTEQK